MRKVARNGRLIKAAGGGKGEVPGRQYVRSAVDQMQFSARIKVLTGRAVQKLRAPVQIFRLLI